MVFMMKGTHLRIPAGGIVIPVDGTELPPVTVEVLVDTWPHWLRIAIGHVASAKVAHQELLSVLQTDSDDGEVKARALESEFMASMQAISSATFALDAFYGSVKERIPADKELAEKWSENKTSRPARISKTFIRAFRVTHPGRTMLRNVVEEVFKFRDYAVHPPAQYREPILHPDLGVGVEWRFIAFTSVASREATGCVLYVIAQLVRAPKSQYTDLVEWATGFGESQIAPMLTEWEAVYGSAPVG